MAVEWFWKISGEEHGPGTPDDLAKAVESGILTPTDTVRAGSDGPWESAENVIAEIRAGRRPDAATSAADSLKRARLTGVRASLGRTSQQSWLSKVWSTVAGLVDSGAGTVAGGIGFVLEKLWTKPGKLLLTGLLFSIVVVIVLPLTPWGEPSPVEVAAHINFAHLVISDLRERQADDDEWDAMQALILEELDPLVRETELLHEQKPVNKDYFFAGTQARSVIRRHIISAGRHGIPRILIDIRNDPDPIVAQLDRDVAAIMNHVSGTEPYPLTVKEARQRKRAMMRSEKQWKARRDFIFNMDPMTATIIVVDIVLVLSGVVYFIRKRRNRLAG